MQYLMSSEQAISLVVLHFQGLRDTYIMSKDIRFDSGLKVGKHKDFIIARLEAERVYQWALALQRCPELMAIADKVIERIADE